MDGRCLTVPADGARRTSPGGLVVTGRSAPVPDGTSGRPTVGSVPAVLAPGIAVRADAIIWVADNNHHHTGPAVIRFGPVSTQGKAVSSSGLLLNPFGITVEAGGTILVSDADAFGGSGGLVRVDPVSGAQTAVSQGGVFVDPFGITVV